MSKKLTYLMALIMSALLLAACGGTPTEQEPADDGADDTTATEGEGGDDAAAAGCDEGTYSLAYQGPLSGDYAALGENMINGIQLAVDQANNGELELPGGGSLPEGVELSIERFDSQGLPDQAPALAQDAASNEQILALIGPAFSGETSASGPIYNDAGLPMLSPSATNPDLTQSGWDYFFRVVATDAAQGPVAARFITENLSAQSVAVIDDSSDYGKGLADLVESSLEELGAEIVARQGVEAGQQDYSAVVGQVAQANADAVFFGGYFSEAGLIRSQLADAGAGDVAFISDDGAFDDEFIEVAGDSAEGAYATYPGANPKEAPEEFTSAYEEISGGAAPGAFTIEAYQAAQIVIDAIATGGCERDAIRDHIRDFDGTVFGDRSISFDENGDIAGQAFNVFVVEGNEWTLEAEIEAPEELLDEAGGDEGTEDEATEEETS